MKNMDKEQTAIRLSILGNLIGGGLGIVFALLSRSEAIRLDGFFSFAMFVMGLLTLKVSRLVMQPDDDKFQFGYAYFEPFLNAIKGLIVLSLCGFALVSAVDAFLHGGRQLELGFALLYTLIAMVGGFILAYVQRRVARTTASPLVKVDARGWLLDGVISAVVAVAFLIALLLKGTPWAGIIPYVDPVLVVLMVIILIRIPFKTVRDSVGELLQVAPAESLQNSVRERLEHVSKDYPFKNKNIRMVKVGRFFYVLMHVLVEPEYRFSQVKELDAIRENINLSVKDLHPALVMDVLFTQDETWAK